MADEDPQEPPPTPPNQGQEELPNQEQVPTPSHASSHEPASVSQNVVPSAVDSFFARLNEQLSSLSPSPVPSSSESTKKFDVAVPDHFTGTPDKLPTFIFEMENSLVKRVPDDMQLPVATTYLKKDAVIWFQGIKESAPDLVNSWASLKEQLKLAYVSVDRKQVAIQRLKGLRQTSAVSRYYTSFLAEAHYTGWNETALVEQFKEGLKPDIIRAVIMSHGQSRSTQYNGLLRGTRCSSVRPQTFV